jgi:exonuclease SbcD
MRFRFLHAADIHLDSPLTGLTQYGSVPAETVRLATRQALENLANIAIEEAVAFVVIAGDVYDGDWDDFSTGLYFIEIMGRLNRANIQVYLIRGNHDASSNITKQLPLPANVHLFPDKAPTTAMHAATDTALHGQSYKTRDPGTNLVLAYPPARPGMFNIGILHTCLTGGRPPHAPYSPCSPAELSAKGYAYWCLGHCHDYEIVQTDPHIVFSGNTQGRSIRETGPKGVVLVTVEDGAVVDLEKIDTDAVRWSAIDVDLSSVSTRDGARQLIQQAFTRTLETEAANRPLMARLILTGVTELHDQFVEAATELREEIRSIAIVLSDKLWLEKIKINTRPPATPEAEVGSVDLDFLAILLGEAQTGELKASLAEDLTEFIARLPVEIGAESDLICAVRGANLETALSMAAGALRARLQRSTQS